VQIDLRRSKIGGTAVLMYDKGGIQVSTGAWVVTCIGDLSFEFSNEDSPFGGVMLDRMRDGRADPGDVKAATLNQVAKLCTVDVLTQLMTIIHNARTDGIRRGREEMTSEIRYLLGIH
jgi:hypothetical protein